MWRVHTIKSGQIILNLKIQFNAKDRYDSLVSTSSDPVLDKIINNRETTNPAADEARHPDQRLAAPSHSLLLAWLQLAWLLLSGGNLSAAELCPAPEFVYTPGQAFAFDPNAPVEAMADSLKSAGDIITLQGKTEITYQNRRLNAENATYNSKSGEVEVAGDLVYESDGIQLKSSDAKIDIKNNTFATGNSRYEINLGDKRASGDASLISRNQEGYFRLEDASYSTCPPGDNSWLIEAKSIVLDSEEGIGTAKNIVLRFKGVPLFAVPTFSFPISPKRKTGFLAPSLASNDSTGFELHVPWYWNIRPNLDATFTPRYMTKRGVQLQAEVRYLNSIGSWALDTEYLYDSDFTPSKRNRQFTRLRHNGKLQDRWSTALDASSVTDKDYFEDLGDSLSVASITHLERRADLLYEDNTYSFLTRLQSYQTVDTAIAPADTPYQRLPQFLFKADWPKLSLGTKADLDAELVYFERTASTTGTRLDIKPRISWPVDRDAWFIKPTLGGRFTYYNLNNQTPSRINRNLFTASLDSGLFFDRITDSDGSVQTLEPRVFMLYVPFRKQDQIPDFDSGKLDFNISQLFRDNRFSGTDRIGDAKQMSLAMTTRFIDGSSGREDLRASIGQILYFNDRRVTLDETDSAVTNEMNTSDSSDIVAEIAAELDEDWRVRTNIQYDYDNDKSIRSSAMVSYRPDSDHILNFGHRNVDSRSNASTEQLDFSVLWPVNNQWSVAGRWNYSLDSDSSIETMLGVEYESCCWAFRFATRRYISDDGSDHDNSYYFQLVLKGLAPVGDNVGKLLGSGVFGYREKY